MVEDVHIVLLQPVIEILLVVVCKIRLCLRLPDYGLGFVKEALVGRLCIGRSGQILI